MKCVVTGGAGFIGSNITKKLVENGEQVKIIDNLSSGNKEKIKSLGKKVDFVKGDVLDKEFLEKEFKGYDIVFHEAAIVSVQGSIDDPGPTFKVNICGTRNVLDAALKNKCKVIFASSSSVYGPPKRLPVKENAKLNPMSPYAESKLQGEKLCNLYFAKHKQKIVNLRYFNVYGPGQEPKSQYAAAIPAFISTMLNDKEPIIFGDGNQTRDFVFVEDIVLANILAAKTDKAIGMTFNVGSGKETSVNDLVKTIAKILGKKVKPKYEAPRIEPRNTLADLSLAKKVLGYKVESSLEQGLRKTVDYFRGSCQEKSIRHY